VSELSLLERLEGQRRYAEAETELLAGYDILTKQTNPSVSWLRAAREDLVKFYTASKQPEKAHRFEDELRGQ
jgi:eukaryotic-like serine/threonine-protein kinase